MFNYQQMYIKHVQLSNVRLNWLLGAFGYLGDVPKSQKLILDIFRHVWPKSTKMIIFIKNRAVLFFYPYCPPTSCQVLEKIVGAVSEINSLDTNIRTYEHTKVKQ